MKHPCKQHGEGFTLIEALLASTILAMAISAILMPFTAGAMNQQVDARRTLGVSLAQEMLEEILAKPFDDPQGADSAPGPDGGESSRSRFDNIDDYHGYVEQEGGIVDFDGAVIEDPAAVGLSRHAWATYVYVDGQDVADPPTFIRVVVEIRYRNDPIVTLTRLIYAMGSG